MNQDKTQNQEEALENVPEKKQEITNQGSTEEKGTGLNNSASKQSHSVESSAQKSSISGDQLANSNQKSSSADEADDSFITLGEYYKQ